MQSPPGYEPTVSRYGARPTVVKEVTAESAARDLAMAAAEFDDENVDHFAETMKSKLAVKRAEGYGGWRDLVECSDAYLSKLLRQHVEKGDPVDVANFCMMLHQRGQAIAGTDVIRSWEEREADRRMGLPR